jgi:hypothetical protein
VQFVRVVYLAAPANARFPTAILAGGDRDWLDALMRTVQADAAACRNGPGGFCVLVPRQAGVLPEVRAGRVWRPAAL